VGRAYHKIWGWVKKHASTATSWGQGEIYAIVEKTICKVGYQFCRSLPSNDLSEIGGNPAALRKRRCQRLRRRPLLQSEILVKFRDAPVETTRFLDKEPWRHGTISVSPMEEMVERLRRHGEVAYAEFSYARRVE
jgi:hypothetical protein